LFLFFRISSEEQFAFAEFEPNCKSHTIFYNTFYNNKENHMASEVKLVRLACNTTEDSTGADEAYLNYNGERVFGIRKINDGQTLEIGVVRRIDGSAVVSLFDEDSPDPDDFLGNITISEQELNRGLRSQNFNRDGARYTLFYRVRVADDD
jgi:hypothetical protein